MQRSPPGGSAGTAWQPFTFCGVARFADAAAWRTWGVVLIAVAALAWATDRYGKAAWLPAVDEAVTRLPAAGRIVSGRLDWPGPGPVELANNGFLRLVINPQVGPVLGQSADVSLEFTSDTLTAQSLFGYWALPYPRDLRLPLDRAGLEPLWAAWRPHFRLAFPLGLALGVIAAWTLGALVGAPFLLLGARLFGREASLVGCWKLTLVTLGPAALGTAVAVELYASRGFRLPDLLVAWTLMYLYALVLSVGSVFCLPRRWANLSPFAPPGPEPAPELLADRAEGDVPPPAEAAPAEPPAPLVSPKVPWQSENPFAAAHPLPDPYAEAPPFAPRDSTLSRRPAAPAVCPPEVPGKQSGPSRSPAGGFEAGDTGCSDPLNPS